MMKITRTQSPLWLQENYKKWGKQWEQRIIKNPKSKFSWGVYQKQKVNDLLLPALSQMTQQHCAFCDAHPMGRITNTIEHFRPKTDYPTLAFTWANLFLCCGNCQQKGSKFHRLLLKPDKESYDFNQYFIYNYATHTLEPNPAQSELNQARAKMTLEIYQLNGFERNKDRAKVFTHFYKTINPNIDDFPFRYMFL
jgi:uncharacterized protein (TIGR02646 family)